MDELEFFKKQVMLYWGFGVLEGTSDFHEMIKAEAIQMTRAELKAEEKCL